MFLGVCSSGLCPSASVSPYLSFSPPSGPCFLALTLGCWPVRSFMYSYVKPVLKIRPGLSPAVGLCGCVSTHACLVFVLSPLCPVCLCQPPPCLPFTTISLSFLPPLHF